MHCATVYSVLQWYSCDLLQQNVIPALIRTYKYLQEVIALEVDAIKYKKYNLDEFGNEIQDIDVCVGYNGQSVSGMILTEMNMVSGWKPNIQSLHDIDCK